VNDSRRAHAQERSFTPNVIREGHSLGAHVPTQELPQLQSLHAFIHDSLYTPGWGYCLRVVTGWSLTLLKERSTVLRLFR
jgi:hypothetical protein